MKRNFFVFFCVLLCMLLSIAGCGRTHSHINDFSLESETDKATYIDTVADTEQHPDTEETAPHPGEIGSDGRLVKAPGRVFSDEDKQNLYKAACEAEDAKNYQYAYGLFSLLGADGWSDSNDRAAKLTRAAYANAVCVVSPDLFFELRDESVLSDVGFLYSDVNGTPRFIYVAESDGKITAMTYTPDTELTGVISFFSVNFYYHYVCICIREDGSLRVFYDKGREQGERCYSDEGKCSHCMTQSSQDTIDRLVSELQSEVGVAKIADGKSYMRFTILYSDGSVRQCHKGNLLLRENAPYKDRAKIIDVAYTDDYDPTYLFSDGSVRSEHESERAKLLTDIPRLHSISGYAFLTGGQVYYDMNGISPPRALSFGEDAVYLLQLYWGAYIMISSDGKVYNEKKELIAQSGELSYICHGSHIDHPCITVGTDGRVKNIIWHENSKWAHYTAKEWYKPLSDELLQANIRIK